MIFVRKSFPLMLSFALSWAFFGCAKQEKPAPPHITDIVFDQAKLDAEKAGLECGSSECPDNVALISVATSEGLKQCLGFLISPDQLATSGTCFQDVRSCAEQAWISFPKTPSAPAQLVNCTAIERLQIGESDTDPSYAVIRLNQVLPRKPVKLSRYGLLDQDKVSVFDVVDSKLVSKSCKVVHDSILIPGSTSARSSMSVISGCELGDISLGAPIIGHDHTVRGIASRVFADSERLRLSLVTQDLSIFSDEFDSASYVTNLACLKLLPAGEDDIDYPECDFPMTGSRAVEELIRKLKERAEATVSVKARAWARANNPPFRFHTEKAAPSTPLGRALGRLFTYEPGDFLGSLILQYFLLPSCVRDVEALLSPHRGTWPYFGGKYPDSAVYTTTVPIWQVREGVDSNTRYVYGTRQTRLGMVIHVEFQPRLLEETGKTPVAITYVDELKYTFELFKGELSVCPSDP